MRRESDDGLDGYPDRGGAQAHYPDGTERGGPVGTEPSAVEAGEVPGVGVEHTVVVGRGIVGLAVARRVLIAHPGARVTLFEKENRLGSHQTGRNSGVVHAGIYYPPGSLNAQLCARGPALLQEYGDERGLSYEERGKLVVAVSTEELPRLAHLERSAVANQVSGLVALDREGIRDVEPHAGGSARCTRRTQRSPISCRSPRLSGRTSSRWAEASPSTHGSPASSARGATSG